ncbi:MAG: transporter substrate binding protein [Massilibacillus sp.]|nr:transporter substrate binding protein [Massilibacillus sp.]
MRCIHLFHIGILQLTQNLDDAVRGFKQGLKELSVEADFHYFNADGNINELPKLAQELAELNVDLIFACSTPAAKAAGNLVTNIPVLFTPVFDPISVNLVDNLEFPGGKLTGMSGMVNADDKVKFIQELLPNVKRLGMLYHTEDSNSLIEASNFRKAVTDKFALSELTITCKEDISLLTETLPQDIDALFLPIGRIIEENFASIAYYTDAIDVPIITSHAPNVVLGSLGALVANHAMLGKACAKQAHQILIEGKDVKAIPVGITDKPEILLNAFVADNLGIEIPASLLAKATEVYE